MDDLEDELDLRHHKGLDPDVYYRCPTSESLDGALQNELERSASSPIPTEIATEFVFAVASTITIPVFQQPHLEALLQPAEFLQSITVEYALCSNIDGKDRLKIQRAVARSVVDAIQEVDGFRYIERRAQNREGSDGARFSFICQDSTQNSNRKRNLKKETTQDSIESDDQNKKDTQATSTLYDCNGAVYVKFSLRRAAINVVYKHNPIHGRASDSDSDLPTLAMEAHSVPNPQSEDTPSTVKKRKRKSKNKTDLETNGGSMLDNPTSVETPKSTKKSKNKKNGTERPMGPLTSPIAKKSKKSKASQSPLSSKKRTAFIDSSVSAGTTKALSCLRCREKKIKCNGVKPTCNQCRRGLWTCQYEVPGQRKRSKNGCLNCKQRRRKCTEEKPSCAYCLRLDEDCEYADDY